MTNELIVEAIGLTHAYRTRHIVTEVLHGIDLTVRSGATVFLTGYSGFGKTTLISLIGCLRSVQGGSLRLFGEELRGARQWRLRKMRRRIGYVFQHFNLLASGFLDRAPERAAEPEVAAGIFIPHRPAPCGRDVGSGGAWR